MFLSFSRVLYIMRSLCFLEGMQYITESVMSVILETKPETSEFQFRSVQLIVILSVQSAQPPVKLKVKFNSQYKRWLYSIILYREF